MKKKAMNQKIELAAKFKIIKKIKLMIIKLET